MTTLYENIKNKRQALGLSQRELADKLGYKSTSTIAKIEAGKNDIPQAKIKEFAKALNTTPSELMGWEEETKKFLPLENLTKLRKEKNIAAKELAEKFNTDAYTILQWESGSREPDKATLLELARYFDVSVDYLLGNTIVRSRIETTAAHMINPYQELTEEEEEKVHEYIKFIRMQTAEKNAKKNK